MFFGNKLVHLSFNRLRFRADEFQIPHLHKALFVTCYAWRTWSLIPLTENYKAEDLTKSPHSSFVFQFCFLSIIFYIGFCSAFVRVDIFIKSISTRHIFFGGHKLKLNKRHTPRFTLLNSRFLRLDNFKSRYYSTFENLSLDFIAFENIFLLRNLSRKIISI